MPMTYISHVIGHEGENSLLSSLIGKGLATSLSAGEMQRLNKQQSGLQISVSLTEKGVSQWEDVIRMTFSFINQIRADGPQEYIYNEKKIMKEIHF